MRLSAFGDKFAASSGISSLMDDLGTALEENPSLLFMGGGNPGRVEAAEAFFQQRIEAVLADPARRHQLFGVYQAPQGDRALRTELAEYLSREYGWRLTPRHVAIANGSQAAFFVLYNLFAGRMADNTQRQIHLPLSPEYVGYADIGLGEDFFTATRPRIERLGEARFRYHVDFPALEIDERVAALCVSRPANPTGNVISDQEVADLAARARAAKVPLILDGAYGLPFPALIYRDARPYWDDNTVLMLSLSKLGLPGARTGIVIAHPDITEAFARANTVVSLACGTLGPQLLRGTLADGSLDRLCRDVLKPYYAERRRLALAVFDRERGELPLQVHAPDGAFFLWLWCENLPIDSRELYKRLKARGVVVLPGNDFFIGTGHDWSHRRECLRLSYAGDATTIRGGMEVLLSELRDVYAGTGNGRSTLGN
ncbi:MAG: valine--pyruvate transaminase [Halieaceae bacterium]|jgi:valine--pyruvate aminotransferase|nr:valine--pyruvate transaminase [Halieaceae bacterium]